MEGPRIRDMNRLKSQEPYPLNVFPDSMVQRIGGYLTYLVYIGRKDVIGTDWGDAFAEAVGGKHLDAPLGIADVVKDGMCWSMKTVKSSDPFNVERIRLISGRCSPDFSYGISDPHKDVQKTGEAVLSIWNKRVDIAMEHHYQARTAVLIRSEDLSSYTLFEEDVERFRITDYTWETNKRGNFIGMDQDGKTRFTWQPHGSQFTVHVSVPKKSTKFRIKLPDSLSKDDVLNLIGFEPSWISIIGDEKVDRTES